MLMKDSFDNIMRKLGAPLPSGASALDAWKVFLTACRPPSDCTPLKRALTPYVASGANVDASGKATFSGLSPATYYVTGNSMFNNQPTFWNVAVEVKPGQTSLQLDQNNGVPLK